MRIAIFGSTGPLGQQITSELLARGHTITALIDDPMKPPTAHDRLEVRRAEIADPAQVADAVRGHDVVISAVAPSTRTPPTIEADAARSLVTALPDAGVRRLLVLGDDDAALACYRTSALDWQCVEPSPAAAREIADILARDERDLSGARA
jgi:putative NADH-flavin reductase